MSDMSAETTSTRDDQETIDLIIGPCNSPTKDRIKKLDRDSELDQDQYQLDSPKARSAADAGDSFRVDEVHRTAVALGEHVKELIVNAIKGPTGNRNKSAHLAMSKAKPKATRGSKPTKMPMLSKLDIVPGTILLLAAVNIDGVLYPPKLPEGHPQTSAIINSYIPFVIHPDDTMKKSRKTRPEYVYLEGAMQCGPCRELAALNWPGRTSKGYPDPTPHVGCVIDVSKIKTLGGCGECRINGNRDCTLTHNPIKGHSDVPLPFPAEQMMSGLTLAEPSHNELLEAQFTTEAVQATAKYLIDLEDANDEIAIDGNIESILKLWFQLARHKDYNGTPEYQDSMAVLNDYFCSDDQGDSDGTDDLDPQNGTGTDVQKDMHRLHDTEGEEGAEDRDSEGGVSSI
ncbi:hypothetical protein HD553DRAFT_346559 [Filobasidium floriforme]|uniref:uncharacterized protein n=1 Tax=Filobasidium floriforme TaxID=5210 RepID=UPI001E8ED57F|nr:uncharacterized protein HD553DRAFT_346559 [Filobasidium floriforme]KAH8077702.1 hypothetical protein HD553DRAFT_346559 [Filobasidium floriforme]